MIKYFFVIGLLLLLPNALISMRNIEPNQNQVLADWKEQIITIVQSLKLHGQPNSAPFEKAKTTKTKSVTTSLTKE